MSPDIDWRVDDDSGEHTVVKTAPNNRSRRRKIALGVVILLGLSLGAIYSSLPESSPLLISTSLSTATRSWLYPPLETSPASSIRRPTALPLRVNPTTVPPTALPATPTMPPAIPTIWTFFSPNVPLATRRDVWRMWRVDIEREPVHTVVISGTTLWAGSPSGIDRINLQTGTTKRYETPEESRLLLPVDRDQALMVAYGGLYYFDGQTWIKARGASNVSSMKIDGDGDLWLYAYERFRSGVTHLTGHLPPTSGDWPVIDRPTSWGPNDCDAWSASANLVSSWTLGGPVTWKTTYVSAAECLRLQSAYPRARDNRVVAVDADRSIWWATDRVLWHLMDSHAISLSLPGTQIYALAADPKHGVWAGTDQGLAYSDGLTFDYPFTDLDTRLFYGTPLGLAINEQGVVWVNLQQNGETRSFSDAVPRWRHVQHTGDGVNIHGVRSIADCARWQLLGHRHLGFVEVKHPDVSATY